MPPPVAVAAMAVELETVGLHPYQARVLAALASAGKPMDSVEIAEAAGIPRTSVYRACYTLTERRLVPVVAGPGPRRWYAPGWNALLDALEAEAVQQLEETRTRLEALWALTRGAAPSPEAVAGA